MGRDLISLLRRRIKDDRYVVAAFTLAVEGASLTSAILEVAASRFIVTTVGGSVASVDLNLADRRYDTIGSLVRTLDAIPGYRCVIDDDAGESHPCVDLSTLPPTEILGTVASLRTRLFADVELFDILDQAAQRHNPGYTIDSVPGPEEGMVLQLAHANLLRIQATDAVRRVGLGETVETLLALARSYEEAYDFDIQRHKRVVASPVLSRSQQNTMREGDVVLGSLSRKSPRNGYMTPMGAALPPDAAVLMEPQDTDIEDDNATIRWMRNTEQDFYTYELWRDTQPNVVRSRQLVLYSERDIDPDDLARSKFDRPTTSKLVFRSFGPNSTTESRAFTAFVESFGQLVNSFIDRDDRGDGLEFGLEPSTEYFYRLYIVNVNGDAVSSQVLRIKTLAKRATFASTGYLSPVTAARASGAAITVTGNNVVAGCQVTVGGIALLNQVVTPGSPGTVVGDLPVFTVGGNKDVVLRSPTHLFVMKNAELEIT